MNRLVPQSETRTLCMQSLHAAMKAGAVAPAVLAGLLLEMHDQVVSHAIDEARDLAMRLERFGPVIERLSIIQQEEKSNGQR